MMKHSVPTPRPTGAPIGEPMGLPDVGDMKGSLWLSPKRVALWSVIVTVLLTVGSSAPV